MQKTLKALQWNIGGGKIREVFADPLDTTAYTREGLAAIIDLMRQEAPDIITVQEAHADARRNQVATIARALHLHYVSDFYSESHIEAGQRLGQGILSRFPLSHHASQLLYNPQFEVTWRTGGKAITHDRGITSCTVHIDGRPLAVKTLHLIPFDPFRVDPQSALAAPIFADLENKLSSTDVRVLLQGDFNLGKHDPPLQLLLPVYTQSVQEATMQTATIPFGEKPDRVVYRGMEISECRILDNVLTDHYPVVTTFAMG